MCLALPMRIVAIDGTVATISAEGLEQRASLALVPEAKVGEYVLVHAGYALNVLGEDDALETLRLLTELAAAAEGDLDGDGRES
ncbi:MAG: HypC/HybG/HupF family hydrogenase formation chaperone [Thermoleophilia bacterium]